jgi:outer membrane protein assembly factor BamB
VEKGWQYHLDATGYPLIHGGKVFLGSEHGLYAVDGQTGEKQWRFQRENNGRAIPVAIQNETLLATDARSYHSNPLYALDPDTGNRIWEADITFTRSVVANGYLHYWYRAEQFFGRVAIDSGDTEEIVSANTDDDLIVRKLRYDVAGDRLVAATRDSGTYFINPDSGDVPFFRTRSQSFDNWIRIALDDSAIYHPVNENDEQIGLEAIDIESGDQLWTWQIGEHDATAGGLGVEVTPAVTDDRVYVFGTNYVLAALDKETGAEQWAVDVFEGPDDQGGEIGPVVAGDTVYVATTDNVNADGRIFAYDAETGNERWRFEEFGARTWFAVAPGVLVAAYWDGPVYTLTEPR